MVQRNLTVPVDRLSHSKAEVPVSGRLTGDKSSIICCAAINQSMARHATGPLGLCCASFSEMMIEVAFMDRIK